MKPISNLPGVEDNAVKLVALDMLVPFSKHRFTLYQGERLDDMVESIKKSGVMVPIIVRTIPDSNKFEILSGHNRVYASGMAGLDRIPAVIKTNISDEMAMIYAVETNLIQRGFRDLKISEQAFAVAMRYRKLFDEKKFYDIEEELLALEKSQYPVGTENNPKDKLSLTAEEYGLGRTSIVRLVRINELSNDFKKLVDTGSIKIRPAVELSYLSQEQQKKLYDVMSELGISSVDMNTAKQIRELCKSCDPFSEQFQEILSGEKSEKSKEIKSYRLIIKPSVYDRFLKDVPKKELGGIVEKALEMYFKDMSA
ncbi:MAG: ParB N-terminal domain-containing protein [Oscillospiraceae bacterium]|nr:ParB N-terminal domain-containing protein [Oscillospiraceae bacterium]